MVWRFLKEFQFYRKSPMHWVNLYCLLNPMAFANTSIPEPILKMNTLDECLNIKGVVVRLLFVTNCC